MRRSVRLVGLAVGTLLVFTWWYLAVNIHSAAPSAAGALRQHARPPRQNGASDVKQGKATVTVTVTVTAPPPSSSATPPPPPPPPPPLLPPPAASVQVVFVDRDRDSGSGAPPAMSKATADALPPCTGGDAPGRWVRGEDAAAGSAVDKRDAELSVVAFLHKKQAAQAQANAQWWQPYTCRYSQHVPQHVQASTGPSTITTSGSSSKQAATMEPACLASSGATWILLAGDSTMRYVFELIVQLFGSPADRDRWSSVRGRDQHADFAFTSSHGIMWSFMFIGGAFNGPSREKLLSVLQAGHGPVLLLYNSGLWDMNESVPYKDYRAALRAFASALRDSGWTGRAVWRDTTPVQVARLRGGREEAMHNGMVDAFNAAAREILVHGAGWATLDAHALVGRGAPDGITSVDGMHYNEPWRRAVLNILLHMACAAAR